MQKSDNDATGLAPHLAEWQLFNPISHVARTNYRGGTCFPVVHLYIVIIDRTLIVGRYGRLDGEGYFPTTVTNVDPTAKQSRVLHPHVCILALEIELH
jgi:DNA (cytosine-5)-methyltransferase 1